MTHKQIVKLLGGKAALSLQKLQFLCATLFQAGASAMSIGNATGTPQQKVLDLAAKCPKSQEFLAFEDDLANRAYEVWQEQTKHKTAKGKKASYARSRAGKGAILGP